MPICIFCLSHPQHCQLRPHGKHKQPCEEQRKGDINKRVYEQMSNTLLELLVRGFTNNCSAAYIRWDALCTGLRFLLERKD